MKKSIHDIFKNLNLFLITTVTIAFIASLFIVEQHYSYEKVQNFHEQKLIFNKVFKEQQISNTVNIIKFNSDIAQINNAIDKLQNQSQYNYISKYIVKNEHEYNLDLEQLQTQIKDFDTQSRVYFKKYHTKKKLSELLNELTSKHIKTTQFIDSLIIKNISYDATRFNMFSKLFLVLLLFLLITTILQKRKLDHIYRAITFLYSSEADKKHAKIDFQEIDAINMRLRRKSKVSDNPAMMDPITEINNNKGMVQSYSERKSSQDNNFTSLAVLEIDNFSKSKRTFSQEFTQELLKKVAYTISLHQQANDIIARTEYNQFTLIFSRTSKEQLFKDVDIIRQSIADLKVSSPDKQALQITITGGFIDKPKNTPLEDSIRNAKTLLDHAKKMGTNKVIQKKDIPHI